MPVEQINLSSCKHLTQVLSFAHGDDLTKIHGSNTYKDKHLTQLLQDQDHLIKKKSPVIQTS